MSEFDFDNVSVEIDEETLHIDFDDIDLEGTILVDDDNEESDIDFE